MIYPKITIITPSFNQGEFLEETICSVLNQGYPNLEYFVIDGGSNDNSVEIIKKYESNVDYWVSEKDRGQQHAINKGLERATGKVINYINSDDYLLPGALDIVAQAYLAHPDAGLYMGNGALVDRHGNKIRRYSTTISFDYTALLKGSNYVLQQSTFFNRKTVEECGYLDETLHFAADLEFFLRVGNKYPVVTIDEELAAFRWYEEIKTASGGFKQWVALWDVISRYTDDELTPGLLVEFFNVLQQNKVQDDLRIDSLGPFARDSFWKFYNMMQKMLGTNDCIPIKNQGIPFVPLKKPSLEPNSKTLSKPGVVKSLGSNPRVDIVLPEGHSWFVREGYAQALKHYKSLGNIFYIPSWSKDDQRSADLFDYLKNPRADVIFLMDSIWHAQQIHNNNAWKNRWQKTPLAKVMFSFECMSNPWLKPNQEWWRDNITAINNAMLCTDALIFAHEIDEDLFAEYELPLLWQPFAIDEALFPQPKDYAQKKQRGFFQGKATQFYGDNIWYSVRRRLIEFLKNNAPSVDVIDQYNDSGPTVEKNKRFIQTMGEYQVVVGLPSLSPTMVVRPFEAMACKSVFVQNEIQGEKSKQLFEDGKEIIYYDYNDPQQLVEKIEKILADPELGQEIAQNGYKKVLEKHTIKNRVGEALAWLDHNFAAISDRQELLANQSDSNSVDIGANEVISLADAKKVQRKDKIIIDGVIFLFQRYRPAGISRVWRSLLTKLANTDLAKDIILLDRDASCPDIPGIQRRPIKGYDYQHFEPDSMYLQTICDEENAGLFISTYYTYTENTCSMIMLHDMIPEIKGQDLTHPEWRAKAKAIEKASAYFCVSQSTQNDFRRLFPQYSDRKIFLTPNAVSEQFRTHTQEQISSFKQNHNIQKPYFLLVGRRLLYKNAILFFRAFSLLENNTDYDIVCTGEMVELEKVFKPYVKGVNVHMLVLNDDELSVAYSGAVALVYPSQYEGFGMPILEAQLSGCPVITCNNSSIPEVAGGKAIFVNEIDVAEMKEALLEVQKADIRRQLIRGGIENAKRFSWKNTARTLGNAIREIRDGVPGMALHPSDPIDIAGRLAHYVVRISPNAKDCANSILRLEEIYAGRCPFYHMEVLHCEDIIAPVIRDILPQLTKDIAPLEECDSLVLFILGLAFEASKCYPEAIGAYSQAFKTAPKDWIYNYRNRVAFRAAVLSRQEGDLQTAQRLLADVVLRNESTNLEAQTLLFSILKDSGQNIANFLVSQAGLQDELETISQPDGFQNLQPSVSVIVSIYNSEIFIKGLIEDLESQSIASQTEIIIVDSNSQQNELATIREFQRQYPNILYLRTKKRESVYAAWNRAIRIARGKYVTNANADDRHHPCAFETMVKVLENQPDIGVVYGDSAITNTNNSTWMEGPIIGRFRWPEFDRKLLFQVCYIGPQPMWRRSLHDEYGYFDPKMTDGGDYEFWLRLSNKTGFQHIPKILGLYLESPASNEHKRAAQSFKESEKARELYWDSKDGARPPLLGAVFLERYTTNPSVPVDNYPLVSVVVPTFNRPAELQRALASIVDQTYPNLEIIVVNDGGRDVSNVINSFTSKRRIRYETHGQNRGAGAARNTGMKLAQGKYIAFLDDDDSYHPEHIFVLMAELEINPSLVASYTDALQTTIDHSSKEIVAKGVAYSIDFSAGELLVRNYIPNLCLMFIRTALEKVGFFDEKMEALEDWEWLIRLSKAGKFSHLPIVTAEYVIQRSGKSRNLITPAQILALYQDIYHRHSTNVPENIRLAQKKFYHSMTSRDMEEDLPELFVPTVNLEARAAETLQALLEADDIESVLKQNVGRLDPTLLKLVQTNAAAARADENDELAEGLEALAEYIGEKISKNQSPTPVTIPVKTAEKSNNTPAKTNRDRRKRRNG